MWWNYYETFRGTCLSVSKKEFSACSGSSYIQISTKNKCVGRNILEWCKSLCCKYTIIYNKLYNQYKYNQLFTQLLLKIFTENMDRFVYRDIIYDYLFPCIGHLYDYRGRVHQDNDPKHNSKLCREALIDCRIKWVSFHSSCLIWGWIENVCVMILIAKGASSGSVSRLEPNRNGVGRP